jgi:hypothetical protein
MKQLMDCALHGTTRKKGQSLNPMFLHVAGTWGIRGTARDHDSSPKQISAVPWNDACLIMFPFLFGICSMIANISIHVVFISVFKKCFLKFLDFNYFFIIVNCFNILYFTLIYFKIKIF